MPIKLGSTKVKPNGISKVFLGTVLVFKKGSKNLFKTTGSKATSSGVTYTPQPDGSVICTGSATGFSSWTMGRALVNSSMGNVTIQVFGTYGCPGNIAVNSIQIRNSSNANIATVSWNTWTSKATVDLSQYPEAASIYISLKRNSNGAVDATIKTQVELGTKATDWEQYEDP